MCESSTLSFLALLTLRASVNGWPREMAAPFQPLSLSFAHPPAPPNPWDSTGTTILQRLKITFSQALESPLFCGRFIPGSIFFTWYARIHHSDFGLRSDVGLRSLLGRRRSPRSLHFFSESPCISFTSFDLRS